MALPYSTRNRAPRTMAKTAASVFVAGTMVLGTAAGTGQVFADPPQQGGVQPQQPPQQGGVGPSDQAPPQQGGVTPAPQPPAPQPAPNAPSYRPGPGGLPPAPYAPPSQHEPSTNAPSNQGVYNPIPQGPIHAPNPRLPKVKRQAPPPETLKVGNIEVKSKDIPDFPDKNATIDWANGWSAYAQQEIANHLISIGVPEDQAVRQAAAAVTGAVASGAIGGAITFTATAVIVGTFAIPIATLVGLGIGSSMGTPQTAAGGAALGFGAGVAFTLATATGTGLAATFLFGMLGALGGWLFGAGDPGDKAKRPDDLLPGGKHRRGGPVIVNPEGNQFELHWDKEDAARHGLPPVDYVVNNRGDVNVTVGNTQIGWTAEQAKAPIQALGPAAPAVEKAINDGTRAVTDAAQQVIGGLEAVWPQEKPAAGPGAKTAAKTSR